jgi:hypothetical protein
MNCAEVAERLGTFADEELPKSIRTEVEEHLEGCTTCRREADRLRANYGVMKKAMGTLAAGDELDESFLESLRPRTKAEVAAAEREASGRGESRTIRNLVIAALVLVAAVAAYLTVLAPKDEEPEDGTRREDAGKRTEEPERRIVRPAPDQRTPPTRRPDRRHPARPVRPDRTPRAEDLPVQITRVVRTGRPNRLDQIVEATAARLAQAGEVEKIRGLLAGAATPEVTGTLLVILGTAPDAASVRPLLVNHLRGGSDPKIRAGAALGLCRTGDRNLKVKYLDMFPLSVGAPDPEATTELSSALGTEVDPGVRGTLVELLAPAAAESEDVARSLFAVFRDDPTGPLTPKIVPALANARHAALGAEIQAWIGSGSVPESAVGGAIALLRGIDPAAAVSAALDALGTAREEDTKLQLVGALTGSRDARAPAALEEILRSETSVDLRRRAVEAAATLPREAALRVLGTAADGDADPEIRALAGNLRKGLEKPVRDGEAGDGR